MAIGSSPITLDLKRTGELWVYIGIFLPNPLGEYRRDSMCVYKILTNRSSIIRLFILMNIEVRRYTNIRSRRDVNFSGPRELFHERRVPEPRTHGDGTGLHST